VLSRGREDGARDPDEVIAFRFLPLSSSGEFLSLFSEQVREAVGRRSVFGFCGKFYLAGEWESKRECVVWSVIVSSSERRC
jgi:hypothetical protein